MAEDLIIPEGLNRAGLYEVLIPQIKALTDGEPDFIANVSNVMAALHTALGFHWVGCYFVKGEELVLGPFQGPVACTRIVFGRGVCGTSWKENGMINVPDVDAFPGHIACSSLSKSELVIPLRDAEGKVWGVLDIDSSREADFSLVDETMLGMIAEHIDQFSRD